MFTRIFNLTGVELSKLIRQRIFYIALVLIILIVVVSVLLESPQGEVSGAEDLGSPQETEEQLLNRPDGGFGLLTHACLNGFGLAAIFLLIFSSLSISGEMTTGTMKMVLIRPIRRSELFLAKALALITIAVGITLLIELISLTLVDIIYGFSNVTDPTYPDTPFSQGTKAIMARYTLYSFVLILIPLITIIFFGLFISTLVENVGIAIALAILVYLFLDYFIIGLFNNIAPYFFSHYQTFYLDKLRDLSGAIADSNWAFKVIDEWLGLGTGEIKNSTLYYDIWQPAVIKSILVPIGYIILFTIPSLIILKKKDVLV